MAGFPKGANDINSSLGQISRDVLDLRHRIDRLSLGLNDLGDQGIADALGSTEQKDIARGAQGELTTLMRLLSGQSWGGANGDPRDLTYFIGRCQGL